VLPPGHETIAGKPVVEDIIKQQAGTVFLFYAGLIRSSVGKVPDAYRHQGVAFRGGRMLLGNASEYKPDISTDHSKDRPALVCAGYIRARKWIFLNRYDGSWLESEAGIRHHLSRGLEPSLQRMSQDHILLPSGKPSPFSIFTPVVV